MAVEVMSYQAVVMRVEPSERFWSRVDALAGPDACWPWTGACAKGVHDRYGRVWFEARVQLAHRVAYAITVGPIPDGAVVMHSCDNPPCCNPAHLSAGSHADNQHDMWAKGRQGRRWKEPLHGERNLMAKLTAEQVLSIRERSTGVRGEQAAFGREFGVGRSYAGEIIRGERWREGPWPNKTA